MPEQTAKQTRPVPELEVLDEQPQVDEGKPPILFVHGAGHGAWCWRFWMEGVAAAGYPAYAVSLRGHAGSDGSLRSANLGSYVNDVIRTAASLPRQPVVVGHSLGGLVVQKVVEQYPARAAVLVAPIPARPGAGTLLTIARQRPLDAARILVGGSLPMRPEYLFNELDATEADRFADQTGRESAIAQFQVLLHLPGDQPLGDAPVLVLGTPEDRLVPISDVRHTARHFGADLLEFPGMGHDLMLDARRDEPMEAMIGWLDSRFSQGSTG